MIPIGANIKKHREAKGIAQSKLEEITGIKREYISKLESGTLKNTTTRTIERIAKGLGIEVSELLSAPDKRITDARSAQQENGRKIKELNKELKQAEVELLAARKIHYDIYMKRLNLICAIA